MTECTADSNLHCSASARSVKDPLFTMDSNQTLQLQRFLICQVLSSVSRCLSCIAICITARDHYWRDCILSQLIYRKRAYSARICTTRSKVLTDRKVLSYRTPRISRELNLTPHRMSYSYTNNQLLLKHFPAKPLLRRERGSAGRKGVCISRF